MTVYVAHAPADREAAEGLERFLERRGQFVELDDGETALRPVQQNDVVVLLVSKDFAMGPTRLRLEQRALDAWADQRLVLVKLGDDAAPVGLRDLPAIKTMAVADGEIKWQEVSEAVRELLGRPARGDASAAPSQPRSTGRRAEFRILAALPLLLIALPGAVALAASGAIWLVNRIGPTPGTFTDLRRGIDEFGMRYGAPSGITEWLFLIAIILTAAVLSYSFVRLLAPRAPAKADPQQNAAVFVSYAHANANDVLPMIEAAKAQGHTFWLNQKGDAGDESATKEASRAIRLADGVVVVCSKASFESDHVKREIYLADRYRKKLTPVFIEPAEPPEDFAYFFAGVQRLKLFETPEAERANALLSALGAPA